MATSAPPRPQSSMSNQPPPTPSWPTAFQRRSSNMEPPPVQLPPGLTAEDFNRAVQVVAATTSAFTRVNNANQDTPQHELRRQFSQISNGHIRDVSKSGQGNAVVNEGEGQGGHDAPNWSRAKSASVLLACTVLYALIAGEFQ